MTETATLAERIRAQARPKVIGIGLHKTSTTSLANALYTLGYYVGGYFDAGEFPSRRELEEDVVDRVRVFDAVQDMPWPAFYRLVDETFPGSKFVLTVRDVDSWLSSVVRHFGDQRIASHELFYGVPTVAGHEDVYREHYRRHEDEVRAYFAGRDDLLVMDIVGGDGWPELCGFLGVPEPPLPFPRQNEGTALGGGRYRRAIEGRARAVAVRVPVLRRFGSTLDAKAAYAGVQVLCQRFDALADTLDPARHEDARAAGMFRLFLEHQLHWAKNVGVDGPLDPASKAIDSWRLAEAWHHLAVLTRRWTADLTDYGTGLRSADGSKATGAVRACVNDGADFWNAISRAFGLDDFDPNPRRPLRAL